MAGIPFLHNIKLNGNMLLDAKLHPSDSAPSNPGIGTIWYDTQNDLVKIYDNTATGNVDGWNTISGDITGVGSATTNQLTVANSSGPVPSFSIVTGAVANGGTALATGDQIHTFVTSGVVDPVQFDGTFTVGVDDTGYDVKFFGATSGKYMLWDESENTLDIQGEITVGVGSDKLKLYGGGSQAVIAGTVNTQGIALEVLDSSGNSSRPIIVGSTGISGTAIKDEDNMSSNSASHLATQQSIKAYVDGKTYDDVSIANLKTRLAGGFGSNAVTIGDSDDVVTIGNDLVITGDLTVSGDTISANVATLNVEDKNITLNYSSGDSSSTAGGSGITIQDAVNSSTDATILWDASNDEFDFSHAINITGTITASGNITGNLVGNVTGTADQVANNLTVDNTTIQLNSGTTYNGSAARTISAKTAAIADGGTGLATADQIYDHVTSRLSTEHAAKNKSFELDNNASGVASSDNITYTITHGMGASRLYKVEVIEDSGNYETVYVEVQRPSDTTIKIIFASAVTAGAYRALITKI